MIDNLEDARERLEEYDLEAGMEIDDTIQECADAGVDVYTGRLWDWAADNRIQVTEAIDNIGWEGCGGTLDGLFAMAQFLSNEQLLRDAWEEIEAELEEKEEAEEEAAEAAE